MDESEVQEEHTDEPITEAVKEGEGESIPTAVQSALERIASETDERFKKIEEKVFAAPVEASEETNEEVAHVDEPEPVIVEHVVDKSPLQRFHEAIG